jgi:hypothetical protein
LEKDVLYVVPLYQRPYVWHQEEQWEPLWSDIQRLAEAILKGWHPRAHFLGATVQDRTEEAPGQIETRLLIDGQQRLTTLQLLLKAFRDAVRAHGNERYAQALSRLARNSHPLSTHKYQTYKVWPTNADQGAFETTMEVDSPSELVKAFDKKPSARRVGQNIPDAYLYFSEVIAEWIGNDHDAAEARTAALYSAIRDNVRLVVIDLDEKDDPQVIFETLNARGTPLLAADLVKNSILNEIRRGDGKLDDAYKKYWSSFDNNSQFWREEIGRGHARRARIEIFLQYVLILLTKGDVEAGHLYTTYSEFASSPSAGTPIERLQQIRRYGSVYEKLASNKARTIRRDVHRTPRCNGRHDRVPLLTRLVRRLRHRRRRRRADPRARGIVSCAKNGVPPKHESVQSQICGAGYGTSRRRFFNCDKRLKHS